MKKNLSVQIRVICVLFIVTRTLIEEAQTSNLRHPVDAHAQLIKGL